jgi:actin-related protein
VLIIENNLFFKTRKIYNPRYLFFIIFMEKGTKLIIDHGSYEIRAGLAEDSVPSIVMRSLYGKRKTTLVNAHTGGSIQTTGCKYGDEAIEKSRYLNIDCTIHNRMN